MRSVRAFARLHLLANHFPPLHGLRALAILSVLQFHLTLAFRNGNLLGANEAFTLTSLRVWFGMDLFFVLSGFLIGTLLAPAADGTPRGGMLRFYVRRSFRIIPLYWFVLTISVLAFPPTAAQRETLVYEYAYLSNYIGPRIGHVVMPWAWSLCVEEHFYLLVPILSLALARLPRPSLRLVALLALWLLAFGFRFAAFVAHRHAWDPVALRDSIYIQTHTRFDTLVAGVLLAQVVRLYGKRIRAALERPAAWFSVAAIALVCLFVLMSPSAQRFPLWIVFAWGSITSVMYFALCILLVASDGVFSRLLSSRAFLRFATLGYGIYLVHAPLVLFPVYPIASMLVRQYHVPVVSTWVFSLVLLTALSTSFAYVLHLLVEKPALWLRDRVTAA
jgi:peptidoglycan/LPS O-acetylase OafA/YrhL